MLCFYLGIFARKSLIFPTGKPVSLAICSSDLLVVKINLTVSAPIAIPAK